MSSNRTDTNSEVNWTREFQYRVFVSAACRLRIVTQDRGRERLAGYDLQMAVDRSQYIQDLNDLNFDFCVA